MFFLRPDRKHGDDAGRIEPMDDKLRIALIDWSSKIPEKIINDAFANNPYDGPHKLLNALAVFYEIRTAANGDASNVNIEMVRNAVCNSANWPTRGYLNQAIGSGEYFEDLGSNDPRLS